MLVFTEISPGDFLIASYIEKDVEDHMHCQKIKLVLNLKKREKDLESC